MNERCARFRDLYASTLEHFINSPHILVGVGAIGGYVGRILGQIGVKRVDLWDHDKIEEVNLGPQGFHAADVGQYKTLSRRADIMQLSPETQITVHSTKLSKRAVYPTEAYWWLCVDSLNGREYITQMAENTMFYRIIDTRMGGPSYEVYCVRGQGDLNAYFHSIQDAREHESTDSCTTKSTPHCAMTAAAIGINLALSDTPPFAVRGDMLSYNQEVTW